MTTKQIRNGEIANYRKMYAAKQKYKCALCGCSIAKGMTALDHCHENGMLRATLCNHCNRAEGKVRKAMRYMAPKSHLVWSDETAFLEGLAEYIKYHKENPSNIIHPTFDIKTGKQKPVKRKKKK